MKIYESPLIFNWILFLRVELTIFQHWFDKPLSEPMMVNLLTHICVTRSQWKPRSSLFYVFRITTVDAWSQGIGTHYIEFSFLRISRFRNHKGYIRRCDVVSYSPMLRRVGCLFSFVYGYALSPGRCTKIGKNLILKYIFCKYIWRIFCNIAQEWVQIIWVNIGSGNGLMPSGNKPLPEPTLTDIFITWTNVDRYLYCHIASLRINELNLMKTCSVREDEIYRIFE